MRVVLTRWRRATTAGLFVGALLAIGAFGAPVASAQTFIGFQPTVMGSGVLTTSGSQGGYPCALTLGVNVQPDNTKTTACATTTTPVPCISIGGNCFPIGPAQIVLTATPTPGWRFIRWDGCPIVGNATCSFVGTAGIPAVVAVFQEIVPIAGSSVPGDFPVNPDFTTTKRPRLTFSSSVSRSPGDTLIYQCQITKAGVVAPVRARSNCTSPLTPASDLTDGTYTYTVWAVHNGDSSLTPLTKTITVDTVAPTTSIDPVSGPQEGSLLTINTATFTFSSSEVGTSQCSLDGAAFATCVSPLALSGLAPGVHSFAVRSLDRAGNLEAAAKTRSWTIFSPPPPQVVVVPNNNPPTTPAAPEQISAVVSFNFAAKGSKTTLKTLSVKNVPFGSTVTVTCTKGTCPSALVKKVKSGTGKKAKTKLVKTPLVFKNAFGTINLKKVISKPLKAGTVLTILVSKPNSIGAVKVMTFRKGKGPLVKTRCMPPGAKSSVAC